MTEVWAEYRGGTYHDLESEPPFHVFTRLSIGPRGFSYYSDFEVSIVSPALVLAMLDRPGDEPEAAGFFDAVRLRESQWMTPRLFMMDVWDRESFESDIVELCRRVSPAPSWGHLGDRLGRTLMWEQQDSYDAFTNEHHGTLYNPHLS